MDLAKRVLQKYGWSEGKGLGKNLDGMKEPLKTKKKDDKAGIGHSLSLTFTNHWWEDVFNTAAGNVKIQTTQDGVKMESERKDTSSVAKSHKLPNRFQSCGFLKREILENGKLVSESASEERCEESLVRPVTLSDEDLFKACGGRTAHKAARHGLKLNGKLRRLEEQDQALLSKRSTNRDVASNTTPTKAENRKKIPECLETSGIIDASNIKEIANGIRKRKRTEEQTTVEDCLSGIKQTFVKDSNCGDSVKQQKSKKQKKHKIS